MKEVSIITGASGTLGKSVAEALLKRNHTVLAISRHSLNKKNKNYYEFNIDLSNLENIEDNKDEILKIFKIENYKKINIIHIAGRYIEQRLPLKYDDIYVYSFLRLLGIFSYKVFQKSKQTNLTITYLLYYIYHKFIINSIYEES